MWVFSIYNIIFYSGKYSVTASWDDEPLNYIDYRIDKSSSIGDYDPFAIYDNSEISVDDISFKFDVDRVTVGAVRSDALIGDPKHPICTLTLHIDGEKLCRFRPRPLIIKLPMHMMLRSLGKMYNSNIISIYDLVEIMKKFRDAAYYSELPFIIDPNTVVKNFINNELSQLFRSDNDRLYFEMIF